SLKDAADILKKNIEIDPYLTMEIFVDFNSVDDLITNLLKRFHKNPKSKPIVYYKNSKTYYGVSFDDDKVILKKLDFKLDISPKLKDQLNEVLEMISACTPRSSIKVKYRNDDYSARYDTIMDTRLNMEKIDIEPASSNAFITGI
ncbi:MAG: hypothetical protein ACRCZI_04370, partial [Cetobacterium sp.]